MLWVFSIKIVTKYLPTKYIIFRFEPFHKSLSIYGIHDFTAPSGRWLEGLRMIEGIDARTEMVMDLDQEGRENLN